MFSNIVSTVIQLDQARKRKDDADMAVLGAGSSSSKAPPLHLAPEDKALLQYLDSLDIPDVYALITLMYVGRDDAAGDLPDLDEATRYNLGMFSAKKIAIGQMYEKSRLAEYLSAGAKRVDPKLVRAAAGRCCR